ncbi:MAG: type IA DNA topoisomerase [Thermoprotei archaeon]|nr:MAG: type IA DNA topoisomerase [Thermoprotei archaeon]
MPLGDRTLIVAEKNKVARAIAKILIGNYSIVKIRSVPVYVGKGVYIIGVRGHIFNLDFISHRRWTRSSIELLFDSRIDYKIREGCWPYVKTLQEIAPRVSKLYLALDNDFEGEHIAWEVLSVVRQKNPYIVAYRVRFSSLDPDEVREAFLRPDTLNMNWVMKCAARQEVDLRGGAIFTRLLTLSFERHMKLPKGRFLSYGPCQSPTLRLIVEPYLKWERGDKYKYVLEVVLNHPLQGEMRFSKTFRRREEAEEAQRELYDLGYGTVTKVIHSTELWEPPKPLDAYELESRASKYLGISSKMTMDLAEELYRDGLISYPRTETQIYRGVDLRKILRRLTKHSALEISSTAERLLRMGFKPTKGIHDDRAHPPIHPIKVAKRGEFNKYGRLKDKAIALYDFIVRHFLATLMPSAKVRRSTAIIRIGRMEFKLEKLKILEDGYLGIYHYERPAEGEVFLKEGDVVKVIKVRVRRVATSPEYLTESQLINLMRRLGIGTDSTIHEHIHTNIERGYAIRRGKRIVPTRLGITLIKGLLKVAPELVDVNLRAWMEKQLSLIGEGVKSRDEVVEQIMSLYREAYLKLLNNLDLVVIPLVEAYRVDKGKR